MTCEPIVFSQQMLLFTCFALITFFPPLVQGGNVIVKMILQAI